MSARVPLLSALRGRAAQLELPMPAQCAARQRESESDYQLVVTLRQRGLHVIRAGRFHRVSKSANGKEMWSVLADRKELLRLCRA